jgi:hypothetical protein
LHDIENSHVLQADPSVWKNSCRLTAAPPSGKVCLVPMLARLNMIARIIWLANIQAEVATGVANLDGAAFFYHFATGVTPAMEMKMVGEGSQYPRASLDSKGNPFDGAKT